MKKISLVAAVLFSTAGLIHAGEKQDYFNSEDQPGQNYWVKTYIETKKPSRKQIRKKHSSSQNVTANENNVPEQPNRNFDFGSDN